VIFSAKIIFPAMRFTLCLVLGLVALAATYDEEPSKEYLKEDKVYKSTNKDYKDDLDEELHKSYDTDGKAVVDLSDEDYEPPKKEELVEHEEHEGEYPSGLPQLPMLPPWMFQHFPFGFPHGFPFFPPPPAHPGQPGPHPHPHYPLPPSPPRYMSKIGEQEDAAHKRERRGAPQLVKKITVKDDDEWWYDVDGGQKNEVTEKFMKTKAGFQTFKRIQDQMDHFAPALHVGTINRGYFSKPEFEAPGDRSFGKGMDFNADEMDAFKYRPHGQHIAIDMDHLEEYLKHGKLPIGRKFIVRRNIVTGYSKCWTNVHTKHIEYQEFVDVFSKSARDEYWNEFGCKAVVPGVYTLVGLKKSVEMNENPDRHDPYKTSHYVLFLKGTNAHTTGLGYLAISDFDPLGLQEDTPVRLDTARHILDSTSDYDGSSFVQRKYMFAQPDVPQLFNHQDTFSGVKIGQDDYRLKHNVFAPYENSIYGTATGVGISGEHDSTHLHHGRVVHQPYHPRHVVD